MQQIIIYLNIYPYRIILFLKTRALHPSTQSLEDTMDHVTRRKTIKFFNIQWSNHTEKEATWESEDFLRSHHLDFVLP
jgi:hypothetical protein